MEFGLEQNYPNPFNPSTEIQFQLPEATYVRLVIYDITRREVAWLMDGMQEEGIHRVNWDADHLSSGVYVYLLDAGSYTEVRQMALLR